MFILYLCTKITYINIMVQLRIKEIATKHGLLLKDVCDKAGYKSLPSFYRQINNPESINMKTLIRIADVIGCDVADFFSAETPTPHIICPKCGEVIPIETVIVPKEEG